ncbi:MAG: 50S ribosomal protein L15 [Clostridia bacterium]|nr:50S ribosomal protein L15 [Clostridia bacterium]
MELHTLSPAPNSKHRVRRVGRGRGSGLGKTSGRGENGQNKRSGGGVRPMFEGGQMPLMLHLGKRGFTNGKFKSQYSIVNVEQLDSFDEGTVITAELLKQKGIIGKIEKDGLKVLGDGKITKALTVKANKFTQSAIKKIQKAGGTVEEA